MADEQQKRGLYCFDSPGGTMIWGQAVGNWYHCSPTTQLVKNARLLAPLAAPVLHHSWSPAPRLFGSWPDCNPGQKGRLRP